MFRTGASRSLQRLCKPPATFRHPATARVTFTGAQLTSTIRSLSSKRPQALAKAQHKPISTSLQRFATTVGSPGHNIDKKHEAAIAQQKLQAEPEEVSTTSTTIPVLEGSPGEKETDMLAGVKADLKTIKDTFALTEVPREAYYIGLAGVLPYLATSASTVYLAWDINHAAIYGHGFLLSGQNAELLLHLVEPLQVGYGAVIISFLGAIHWGLEWAGYGGYQRYRRYAYGVVAPAVAWPTMLLPVEYALIAQFLAFNFLYFADARATTRGWCPPWYQTYRFVLTFIVGTSIVLSLIGRGQIADKIGALPGPADKMKALRDSQLENLQKEEEMKRAKIVEADESEDDGEDEAEGEGEGEGEGDGEGEEEGEGEGESESESESEE
ncbi:MAG: hypothetical protein M1837_004407 [Sclerophora amabilis]|nr:MAG: hypothetical protein M1837_004407 [Sclerophora amabilis]